MRSLARLLDKVGLGVLPTRKQTQCFIACSSLFNLTALISFRDDTVAGNERNKFRSQENQDNSDVLWLTGLKQISSPNKAQSCDVRHEYVAIVVQPLKKTERHRCAKRL